MLVIEASSVIFIEAWALCIAFVVALDMNLDETIFESDCLALINCLSSSNDQGPWEIRSLVNDVKTWASTKHLIGNLFGVVGIPMALPIGLPLNAWIGEFCSKRIVFCPA